MRHLSAVTACALLAGIAATAGAQSRASVPLAPEATAQGPRPVPGPVYEIPEFTRAVERGTRTRGGRPGAGYWVQHARYSIDVRLDPSTDRVIRARADDLPEQLARHRSGDWPSPAPERVRGRRTPRRQTGADHRWHDARRVAVDEHGHQAEVERRDGGADHATWRKAESDRRGRLLGRRHGDVDPARDAAPAGRQCAARLRVVVRPPPSPSDGREGREGHHVYFMGYWYPQIAVYDDVNGWVTDPYCSRRSSTWIPPTTTCA